MVLDSSHKGISLSDQCVEHDVKVVRTRGEGSVELVLGGWGKVVPERCCGGGDGDLFGGFSVVGGGTVEEFGHGGGAEVPWVTFGGAVAVVDVFWVSTVFERKKQREKHHVSSKLARKDGMGKRN